MARTFPPPPRLLRARRSVYAKAGGFDVLAEMIVGVLGALSGTVLDPHRPLAVLKLQRAG